MAKTKYKGYNPADYTQQQENIRKAKGNPNKNIHHKKNGSNYGGGDYLSRKASQRMEQAEKKKESIFDMTGTQRIIFVVLLLLAVVGMILSRTVLKDSAAANYLPSLLLGLLACFMASVGYGNRAKRKGTLQTILLVVLVVLGAVYTLMGILGFANLLGA